MSDRPAVPPAASADATWTENRSLLEMRADDLRREGVVFRHDDHLYRTTGRHLSHGGMGSVFLMERRADARPGEHAGTAEEVVGKVFHAQYLYQLRTDDVARRDYQTTMNALEAIRRIDHPHLLPVYVSQRLADNHLLVSPRMADTLLEVVARGDASPRRRVRLLIQALEGLYALHDNRLIHRDFTLRNILVDGTGEHAYLFDFDLALRLDDIAGTTCGAHYQGRIFGSPGFSVPPEIVDDMLADHPITARLDIYAIGGALFRLFSDSNPHGSTDDMWGLLMRIAQGVVFNGISHIVYPEDVPASVRPVIERCLERDPGSRFGSVRLVVDELERCLEALDDLERDNAPAFDLVDTAVHGLHDERLRRVRSLPGASKLPNVTPGFLDLLEAALERYGYRVERSLGRIKDRSIFLAAPIPELVASGQFPYANTYPKIVTAVNLNLAPNAQAALDLWFGRYLPVLESVRQGLFTSLYKAIYDEFTGYLLLFSEFVDDPRFGTDLAKHELTLVEAFGLGFLIARQVGQLHEHGLAHNNVGATSLMFKGVRDSRLVLPSMAGLVEPSTDIEAIRGDIRHLAGLVLSWLRPGRVEAAEQQVRRQLEELRARLGSIAFNEQATPPGIDELFALVANALSAVDHNFRVLREHRGDLQDYVLLQLGHRLYPRLWPAL
jgi:serine/threonine protein kinase